MIYLYHTVPENMQGDILYPMNVLKDMKPELYEKLLSGYAHRPHIMKKYIPTLGCVWNDVIHFSLVDPLILNGALKDAGFSPSGSVFKIPISLLDPAKATIYINKKDEEGVVISLDNFVDFTEENVTKYNEINDITRRYFSEMHKLKKLPLKHRFLPHVLYRGTIDIDGLEIIKI